MRCSITASTRACRARQRCCSGCSAFPPMAGSATPLLAAVRKRDATDLIARLCDERLAFLQRLKTWPVFGAGWGRRVAEVRAAALAMAQSKIKVQAATAASAGKAVVPVNRKAQQASAGGIAGPGAAAAQQAHQSGARLAIVIAILCVTAALRRRPGGGGAPGNGINRKAEHETGLEGSRADGDRPRRAVARPGAGRAAWRNGRKNSRRCAGRVDGHARRRQRGDRVPQHRRRPFIAQRRARPRANGSRRWPRSARRRSRRSARRSARKWSAAIRCSAGGVRSTRWSFRCWNVPAFALTLLHALWSGHEAGINGFASLSSLLMAYFGARFGVLGIYVNGRSREKQACATGQVQPSAIDQVVKALVKKK